MFLLLYASKYGNSNVKYLAGAAVCLHKLNLLYADTSDAGKQ